MPLVTPEDDALVRQGPAGAEPGWFDRFYTNLHPATGGPLLMLGAGVYPGEGLVDGYAIAVLGDEQRNLRVSDVADPRALPGAVGPLSWETLEPLRRWRVRLAANPSGLAAELTWTARTPAWECHPVHLDDGRGNTAVFDHAFQSGHQHGWVEVDGVRTEVDGWTGQRDRSRGRRMATARQGLHLWVQAQFGDESLAFLHDLDRAGRPTLLDGAALGADGGTDRITEAGHALSFTDELEAGPGTLWLRTERGRRIELRVDPTVSRGGFLAGGGYGGFHGRPHGPGHLEHDRYDLRDGRWVPRLLGYPLTDRLAAFRRVEGGVSEDGAGVFEFAHTRSPAYRYSPSGRPW
jgi:hypothetical protein